MNKKWNNRLIVFREILPYANGIKRYWILLMFASIVMLLLEFLTPTIYKEFIDDVILGKNMPRLYVVIVKYLSVFLVGALMKYIKIWAKYKVAGTMIWLIRKKILFNLFEIPFSKYEDLNVGDVKMRIDDDAEHINSLIDYQTIHYLLACITILVSVTILGSMNWVLTAFSVVAIPLTFWIDYVIGIREKRILDGQRENQQKMYTWLHDSIQGWKEVKALNLAKREERKYCRYLHTDMVYFAKWINYWTARVLIIPKIKNEFFMQFGLYLIGGLLIINNKMGISNLLLFAVYYSMLANAVKTVSSANAELQSMMPFIDRLFKSLRTSDRMGGEKIIPDQTNTIDLENVSFTYPESSVCVIENFNLTIHKGERIAITGKSGSGKTTLLKLITGMIEPTYGKVMFSGVNIKEIDMEAMHKRIGYVMQENILFHTSIKENLLYAKADASEEEIVSVCKQAGILEFILSLSDGFDTIIGEKGIKLSGGQRQRIVLARMLLQNVDIFIFDEATSALDHYSESIIHDAIKNIARNKTVIVVAHRESSIKLCDRVVEIR